MAPAMPGVEVRAGQGAPRRGTTAPRAVQLREPGVQQAQARQVVSLVDPWRTESLHGLRTALYRLRGGPNRPDEGLRRPAWAERPIPEVLPAIAKVSETPVAGNSALAAMSSYKIVIDTLRIALANLESEPAVTLSRHRDRPREEKKLLATLFAGLAPSASHHAR